MLIKIDPILSPELLFTLRTMGHGDKLVLADANFPANSMNKNVIRLDGVNIHSQLSDDPQLLWNPQVRPSPIHPIGPHSQLSDVPLLWNPHR